MKKIFPLLIAILVTTPLTKAQVATPLPILNELAPGDVRQAAIAFVNITTAPGVEGAVMRVDTPERDADLWRSSIGFNAEFALRESIINGYWGASITTGGLHDELTITDTTGKTALFDIDRDITSARVMGGFALPITQSFKLRPSLHLIASRLKTDSQIRQPVNALNTLSSDAPMDTSVLQPSPFESALIIDQDLSSSVNTLTTAINVEALYDHWFGQQHQIELNAQYTAAYSDSYDSSHDHLSFWAWNQNVQIKTRLSGPTPWQTANRKWRWNGYLNHTNFLDQDKSAIGFKYYYEFGGGLDWEWNSKPLNWFGLRYLGIRAGYIKGDDVEGANIGLTFR